MGKLGTYGLTVVLRVFLLDIYRSFYRFCESVINVKIDIWNIGFSFRGSDMQSSLQKLEQEAKAAAGDIIHLLKRAKTYRIVILIIGRPGSGKSTFASFLEDELNNAFIKEGRECDVNSKIYTEETDENEPPLNDAHTRLLPIHTKELENEVDAQINNSEFEPITYIKPDNPDEFVTIGRGMFSTAISASTGLTDTTNHKFAKRITMDGFHLPRSVLRKTTDPEFMMKRRGAAFTFDSGLVVKLVEDLITTCNKCKLTEEGMLLNSKNPLWMFKQSSLPELSIPNFDHEKKDPTPGGTIVNSDVRVVILEGLYLMYNQGQWKRISALVKENNNEIHVWKVKATNLDIVRERTAKRHVKAGVCKTIEEGRIKYDMNDKINGDLVDNESRNEFIEKEIKN